MADKPPRDEDTVEALELLSEPLPGLAPPPPPVPRPRPDGEDVPPQERPMSAARPAEILPTDVDSDGPPWRCLRCAYPLMGSEAADVIRCSECGQEHEPHDLERWFGWEEARRFNSVLWLVSAMLFVKLLILPDFLVAARLGTTVLLAWACIAAMKDKLESTAGYYGLAGFLTATLMFFVYLGSASTLAFHALEIIAACLLLLTLLHDPHVGRIGAQISGGQLPFVLLFAAPGLAVACYLLALWADSAPGGGTLPSLGHTAFALVVPYAAAVGVWVWVWLTLRRVRTAFWGRAT